MIELYDRSRNAASSGQVRSRSESNSTAVARSRRRADDDHDWTREASFGAERGVGNGGRTAVVSGRLLSIA